MGQAADFMFVVQQVVGGKPYDVSHYLTFGEAHQEFHQLCKRWPRATFQLTSRGMNGEEVLVISPYQRKGVEQSIINHAGQFHHSGYSSRIRRAS